MLETNRTTERQNDIPTEISFKYQKRYSTNQFIKKSEVGVPHDVSGYKELSDVLDNESDDAQTMVKKTLTGDKERKDKKSSQKVNGDDYF